MPNLLRKCGDGVSLPEASTAGRAVASKSNNHFCGHAVFGDGSGRGAFTGSAARVVQMESFTELRWGLCLSLRPDIADLREQVPFEWFDEDGVCHTHFFDFLVVRTDGARIACAVRAAARTGGRFAKNMPRIAAQVRDRGFAVDVRLLSDEDLDPVEVGNAWLLHGLRAPDPEADTVAAGVLAAMSGLVSLQELTDRTGLGVAGFRALLRLVRSHHLRLVRPEPITRNTVVYKGSNL